MQMQFVIRELTEHKSHEDMRSLNFERQTMSIRNGKALVKFRKSLLGVPTQESDRKSSASPH